MLFAVHAEHLLHRHTKKLLLIGNPTTAGTGYDSLVNAFAEIRGYRKAFSCGHPNRSNAIRGGARRLREEQAGGILLHPLCGSRHGKPVGSAGFGRGTFADARQSRTTSNSMPATSCVILCTPDWSPSPACYGSGLRAYAGEGLVGLSWAFLRAGAHNVIGALWEVNDASTPLLMDKLYAELDAGNSPDAALRAAKLSLIHSPAVYRKPLYWAGFQLYTRS